MAALAAAAPRLDRLDAAQLSYLLSQLEPARPPLVRRDAADALGKVRLDDAQLETLAGAVASVGALELPLLVSAFERSKNAAVGKKLIAALVKAPDLPSLSPETLRRTLKDYPAEVAEAAAPLFKRLQLDTETKKARLADFEPVLHGGNAKQGRSVFFGAKAACGTCHSVGTEGGNVGPDLSKIGSIRTGRDLLEALVFPSASIARGYEPYVIATKDGRVHTGILGRDTAEALILVTAERAEIRIPRSAIEDLHLGQVSIMPQGLDAQLSQGELRDLIAFLLSLK